MSESAWAEEKGEILVGRQGRRLLALSPQFTHCYVLYRAVEPVVINGSFVDHVRCRRAQFFEDLDCGRLHLRWVPHGGRKVREQWLGPSDAPEAPRGLVFSKNLSNWKTRKDKDERGRPLVYVLPFPSWDAAIHRLSGISDSRDHILFELGVGVVEPPPGNRHPEADNSCHDGFARDPAVRLWSLVRADWLCELCGCSAPFHTREGVPYLEVHHIQRLADSGPDVPENTAALCPACHREVHYGENAELLSLKLSALRADG